MEESSGLEHGSMMVGDEATLGTGARLLKLLQCVVEAEREFTLKDIAARLGLPPSTTHRLLQLFVRNDIIERLDPQGYRLGRELFRLGALIVEKFDVQRIARPFLEELRAEWEETASLCLYMPATRTSMVVETVRTAHPLQYVIEPLSHLPLAWGSLGRAILAHLPPADIDKVITELRPGPISGKPPPTRTRLKEELQRVKRQGFAVYEDRTAPDIAGIAAPVFGHDGKILGSVGVTMPGPRFELIAKDRLAGSVAHQAREISAALGFSAQGAGRR